MKWIIPLISIALLGCSSGESYDTFGDYLEHEISDEDKSYSASVDKIHSFSIKSPDMKIDRIYRSMQGPSELTEFKVVDDEELIWLVGYEGEVTSKNGKASDGFMCHNNMDIFNKEDCPWKVRTLGTSTRIFTLTEGQTKISLPEGFGIPITSNLALQMASQVLNHNNPKANVKVNHNVKLKYKRQSELSKPLIPLYQQAIFVTKQTSGPQGEFGMSPDAKFEKVKESEVHVCTQNCEIEYEGDFNPYQDQFGRVYNGHWAIAPNQEVLKTDVTQMMNLEFDTKIHFISIHVHPFATSLELIDQTTGESLYKGTAVNHNDKIGLAKIDFASFPEGLKVYKDHKYILKSVYQCDRPDEGHTAMATMFLYLADK